MAVKTAKIIDERVISNIEKSFKNFNAGANEALALFVEIESVALWELKGKFSASELKAIIDVTNSTVIDRHWLTGGSLIAELEDADRLDGLGAKHGINVKALCNRLREFSKIQIFFLACWGNRYWYGADELPDFDEYIKKQL